MRFLFIAPRYHSNQHHCVTALKQAGHEVRFQVNRIGRSENHEAVVPTVFRTSLISKIAMAFGRVFSEKGSSEERLHRHFGFPSFVGQLLWVRAYAPDLVIIRNPSHAISKLMVWVCALLRLNTVLYMLRPLDEQVECAFLNHKAYRALLPRAPVMWMSAVAGGFDYEPQHADAIRYIRFPMNVRPPISRTRKVGAPLRIVCVAKYVPRKNHMLLIDALRTLVNEGFDVTLDIYGTTGRPGRVAQRDRIERHIIETGLDGRIQICTPVEHASMLARYEDYDCFVLPSSDEPAGIVVLEAMGAGLPVIVSDSVNCQCYLRPNETGWVFQSDSQESLTGALREMMKRAEELGAMGDKNRELVRTRHSLLGYAAALEEVVRMLDSKQRKTITAQS